MVMRPTLSELMRELAERSPVSREKLIAHADALDAAIDRMGEEGGVKRMLGAWARARRVWCDITGEPLV